MTSMDLVLLVKKCDGDFQNLISLYYRATDKKIKDCLHFSRKGRTQHFVGPALSGGPAARELSGSKAGLGLDSNDAS